MTCLKTICFDFQFIVNFISNNTNYVIIFNIFVLTGQFITFTRYGRSPFELKNAGEYSMNQFCQGEVPENPGTNKRVRAN